MRIDRKLSAEAQAAASGRSGGATILVVDDSRLQRRILASLLKRSGHQVVEAASGFEALEACRSVSPDFILSDWMMPGMNGLEFCRAFRALGQESYVYFILLTSKSEKGEIAEGLDAGADDFLTKPVNADELRARIVAGQRILDMQKELQDKNQVVQATLTELQGLYDGIDRDLIEARKLQHSLIREPFCRLERADVNLFLRSSGRVGGDLVGSYRIDPDRVGIYAIDVSGHGIASALMTARLAGYLSAAAPDHNIALRAADGGYAGLPPSQVVAKLNSLVLDESETEHYLTICLAEVNLATGEVALCQAGHPHPAIQRADGTVEFFGQGGFPVGLIDGAGYSETRTRMHPGDRILLYSDGITECTDRDGNFFEEAGLEAFLLSSKDQPDLALFDLLMDALEDFTGQEGFADDISAVLLDFRG